MPDAGYPMPGTGYPMQDAMWRGSRQGGRAECRIQEGRVVVNTGDSIIDAIDICLRYGYSFRDSMIIEAAIKGGATVLISEDLQDGQVVSGVTIKNPI